MGSPIDLLESFESRYGTYSTIIDNYVSSDEADKRRHESIINQHNRLRKAVYWYKLGIEKGVNSVSKDSDNNDCTNCSYCTVCGRTNK